MNTCKLTVKERRSELEVSTEESGTEAKTPQNWKAQNMSTGKLRLNYWSEGEDVGSKKQWQLLNFVNYLINVILNWH